MKNTELNIKITLNENGDLLNKIDLTNKIDKFIWSLREQKTKNYNIKKVMFD